MQYTPHYNLNLPEGTDIVNPLIQDNPNYSAIDDALYANKLRVIGTATELKTGTSHALTRSDQDIAAFKFVATSDYITGDTFTVDGVSVTAKRADGSSIKNKAYVINSTVLCILDGTILNIIGVDGEVYAKDVIFNNAGTGINATNSEGAIKELDSRSTWKLLASVGSGVDVALPADFEELFIRVNNTSTPNDGGSTMVPAIDLLSAGTSYLRAEWGFEYTGAYHSHVAAISVASRSTLNLLNVSQIGTDGVTNESANAMIWVYYR